MLFAFKKRNQDARWSLEEQMLISQECSSGYLLLSSDGINRAIDVLATADKMGHGDALYRLALMILDVTTIEKDTFQRCGVVPSQHERLFSL